MMALKDEEQEDSEMHLLSPKEEEGDFEDEESFISEGGSKYRTSFAEKLLLKNAPEDLKQQFKHSKNMDTAHETIELIKMHLNQGEKFKDILRREILEYIVKGFEHIYSKGEEIKKGNMLNDLFKPQEEK